MDLLQKLAKELLKALHKSAAGKDLRDIHGV
jgi:hypothetical protein